MSKLKKRLLLSLLAVVTLIAVIVCVFFIYVSDYYRADTAAIAGYEGQGIPVTVTEQNDGSIVYAPKNAEVGFIFYPGGKVEHKAYAPLMQALSERGVLCVLIKMPFNLAVLDINAADGVCDKYPGIDRWYIGGHSLGGSMAASYALEHTDDIDGLVLLAAYSTADLSDSGLDVLSVYGSNDRVLNMEKYKANIKNLPDGFSENVIDGGNHAYFGMYGEQKGDGKATIANHQQINSTALIIDVFIK